MIIYETITIIIFILIIIRIIVRYIAICHLCTCCRGFFTMDINWSVTCHPPFVVSSSGHRHGEDTAPSRGFFRCGHAWRESCDAFEHWQMPQRCQSHPLFFYLFGHVAAVEQCCCYILLARFCFLHGFWSVPPKTGPIWAETPVERCCYSILLHPMCFMDTSISKYFMEILRHPCFCNGM